MTEDGQAVMRGRFITLEGGEGAGKTTQSRLLVERLRAAGVACIATREPGGSDGAEAIRALLVTGETGRWSAVTEALLHTAARRDHLERTVWPALDAGTWVVCDRFFDSTLAYQGYGLGIPHDDLKALYRLAIGDFAPDLTLMFEIDVSLGLMRADARRGSETRYESMDRGFHDRLRDGFLAIAAADPRRCVTIDAVPAPDVVGNAVWAAVMARWPELGA